MGYMQHRAIICTFKSARLAAEAHLVARGLAQTITDDFKEGDGIISNVTVSAVNGYASFMFGTDGSKLGWDESTNALRARKEFIEYLQENCKDQCDWVEVIYGDDNGYVGAINGNQQQINVMSVIKQQYYKMRSLKGHTVEGDVKHNSNYELAFAGSIFAIPDPHSCDYADFKELCEKFLPDWNQEWLLKTRERSYKDRLKVGISLLIAELERVMYLENQRIENNDSSTASSSGDPESNR